MTWKYDDLNDWKSKHCMDTENKGEGVDMLCITKSGIIVHKGYGCDGCPYQ